MTRWAVPVSRPRRLETVGDPVLWALQGYAPEAVADLEGRRALHERAGHAFGVSGDACPGCQMYGRQLAAARAQLAPASAPAQEASV